MLTPENDAELVSVQGQFLSVLTTPTERVLVLKMGETVFDAGLDKTTGDGALNDIRPGSLVSITGVYSYQAGPPPSFRLLLRSPRDVVLVAAAPWWTLRHTLSGARASSALYDSQASSWIAHLGGGSGGGSKSTCTAFNCLLTRSSSC